jgi:hypothetical protein
LLNNRPAVVHSASILFGTFGVLALPLLAVGVGQPAAALLREALASTVQLALDHAALGRFSLDYPDLVLAAVLGAMVADRAIQQPAALLVTISAGAYGALFAFADTLLATVPVALVRVLVEWGPRRAPRRCGTESFAAAAA